MTITTDEPRTVTRTSPVPEGTGQRLEDIAAAAFNQGKFVPPNANMPYDENFLVYAQDKYNDIADRVKRIEKNPFDRKGRRDLYGIMKGDKNAHIGVAPETVSEFAKDSLDYTSEGLGRYVQKHYGSISSELTGKPGAWVTLVMQAGLPFYKTGNADHNKLRDKLVRMKGYEEITEKDDIKEMTKVVSNMIENDPKLLDWERSFLKKVVGRDPNATKAAFGEEVQSLAIAINNTFVLPNGRPNDSLARNFYESSLRAAEDELRYEIDEGEGIDQGKLSDLWEEIRDYHLAMSKVFYAAKNPEIEAKNENIAKLRERERRRALIGMKN